MDKSSKSPPTLEYLRQHREQILALAEQYGAYNIRVFGSVARGDSTSESDVDLLVSFKAHSLLDRIALKRQLGELLDLDIDVVQEKMLKDHVKPHVMKDVIPL